MSDPVRHDQDPAALVAAELRGRLRAMGGDELVELCAQLLTTYVIEGVVPLSRAAESNELAADAAEESFAQKIPRLKAAKTDPVLERFIIDGENISVRIDGQGVLPITEYRRPAGPPRAPGVSVVEAPARRESVPGAAGSIYNRALYQEEPPQQRAAPPSRPAQQPPSPQPAPAQQRPAQQQPPAQPGPQKKEEPKSDRFSLIELE